MKHDMSPLSVLKDMKKDNLSSSGKLLQTSIDFNNIDCEEHKEADKFEDKEFSEDLPEDIT